MFLIRKTGPSNGAVALRDALRAAEESALFSERTSFTRNPRVVINWGDVEDAEMHPRGVLLNKRSNRRVATNKLASFAVLTASNVPVPRHFTTQQAALEWRSGVPANRRPILLARTTATGSGGEGITVVRANEPIPQALFYSEYIRKTAEYRVHVVRGQAIAIQQKRAVAGVERNEDQMLIRNHGNGWAFAVHNVDSHSETVMEVAVNATNALGLDFAAVDLVRTAAGAVYVLEANTKPGLESETVLGAYVRALVALKPE